MADIGLLLGKPPHRSPVLGEVVRRLEDVGHVVSTAVLRAGDPVPGWCDQADAVAVRGLDRATLATLAARAPGVRFVDDPGDVLRVRDRQHLADTLRDAGVAVPDQHLAASWDEVLACADAVAPTPIVVKQRDGTVGRGAGVCIATVASLPSDPPFPGPHIVQRWVGDTSDEIKLYRFGARLRAVAVAGPRPGAEVTVTTPLRELGDRVAAATGLSLFGVDVVATAATPIAIDVNAFPSGRRLTDAATHIAAHLERVARRVGTTANAP